MSMICATNITLSMHGIRQLENKLSQKCTIEFSSISSLCLSNFKDTSSLIYYSCHSNMFLFHLTAHGYPVDPWGGVHVPQSFRQDILVQVVREPREEIEEFRQAKAEQELQVRATLRDLPLCRHCEFEDKLSWFDIHLYKHNLKLLMQNW